MKLRDASSHKHYCDLLNDQLGAFYGTTYGINRDSVLNQLKYTHVCEELLPPDIMHDILEGYLPFVMKQLLHSVRQFGVNLQFLNDSIKSFSYGSDAIPSTIPDALLKTEGTHLGQSGMCL